MGGNLAALPATVAELLVPLAPWPDVFRIDSRLAAGLALALALAGGALVATRRRFGLVVDRQLVVLGATLAGLAAYYGLFFGAAYFLSRYLFPLTIVGVVATCAAWARCAERWPRSATLAACGAIAVIVVSGGRFTVRGAAHPHLHVVDWVRAHVGEDQWVAAPQSGTLGYFHDRTVNLDGKVNPDALNARRRRELFPYIVNDARIEYLADWYGLARWWDRPESVPEAGDPGALLRAFDVRLRDPAHNLFVLQRRREAPAGSVNRP